MLEDYIICAVCGKRYKSITPTHLALHKCTMGAYRATYPSAPILSEKLCEQRSALHKGKPKSAAHRAKMAAAARGRKCSPETRAKICAARGHRGFPHSPAARAKISAAAKNRSPETLAKMSAARKAYFALPKNRIRQSLTHRAESLSDVTLAKMSASQKLRFRSANERKKISLAVGSGPAHHTWRGGSSLEPYGLGFNRVLKAEIRLRDNRMCQACTTLLAKRFAVHHIDYNKSNNASWNLIYLCKSCHSKTSINRGYWTPRLQDLMVHKEQMLGRV